MAGKPKKSELVKSYMLRIRMTEAERLLFEEVAKLQSLETSTWARSELVALAKKVKLHETLTNKAKESSKSFNVSPEMDFQVLKLVRGYGNSAQKAKFRETLREIWKARRGITSGEALYLYYEPGDYFDATMDADLSELF